MCPGLVGHYSAMFQLTKSLSGSKFKKCAALVREAELGHQK